MLSVINRKQTRRVAITISVPHRHGTLSHDRIPPQITVGQLLQWLSHATRHGADYAYALRDEATGRLLSSDETLGQIARSHGPRVSLRLHVDPRMA